MPGLSRFLTIAFVGGWWCVVFAQQIEAPRDAATTAREALRDDARAWVANQTGVEIGSVNVASLDARVMPPPCDGGFRFDFPFDSRATVRAQCDRPTRQYYMRVIAERPRARIVAARSLPAGTLLAAADLTTRDSGPQAGGVEDPSLLIGRFLRRPLDAGEPVSVNDLEDRVQVFKAARDLRSGDSIEINALRVEMMPRTRIPNGVVVNAEELKTAKLRRDVPADRVITSEDLIDSRPTVVATRNLLRGETINATSLEVVAVDRRRLPPDHIAGTQGLEGAEVTSPVRAGEPLRASQVRPAVLVRRGQPVLFLVSRDGLEISIQVEALEDARLGESVKLRNPDSGKPLGGTVTGRGTVRAL